MNKTENDRQGVFSYYLCYVLQDRDSYYPETDIGQGSILGTGLEDSKSNCQIFGSCLKCLPQLQEVVSRFQGFQGLKKQIALMLVSRVSSDESLLVIFPDFLHYSHRYSTVWKVNKISVFSSKYLKRGQNPEQEVCQVYPLRTTRLFKYQD